MKRTVLIISLVLSAIILMSVGCRKTIDRNYNPKDVFTAKFEIYAICSNYTFTVVNGNIDMSLVEEKWTNPQTGITYANAFGILNPCDLPSNIKKGDTFKCVIVNNSNNCQVCDAYYPSPNKKLSIKVIR